MKKLKKLMALLLSVVMILAMGVTVFAATPATSGSLKINVKDGGSLMGQKIYIFKLMDLTETDPADYNVNSTYEETLKTVLSIGEVEDVDYAVYSALAAHTNLQQFANDFTSAVLAGGSITGTASTDYYISGGISGASTYTFTDVAPGYYLVYLGGSQTIQSSLVTVNGAAATEAGKINEVNLKSETPTPEKEANVTSVNIGDVVTYTVKFTIPDITGYDTNSYVFTLKDTLSDGLDFVKSATDKTVVNSGSLSVSVQVGSAAASDMNATITGRNMTLDLSDVVTANQNPKNQEVTVTYYAQVNENAVFNNTSNSARLEYSNDPATTETGDSVPDVVKTPTFDIKVHKYEKGKDTEYLAGAVFELHRESEDGTIVKMSEESVTGYYTVAKNQEEASVTELKTAGAQISTTGANLQINGLKAGVYYLVEKETPGNAYNLAAPVKIEIVDKTAGTDEVSYKIKVNDGAEADIAKIENSRGTILPGTGGMGTVIFTVAGLVLILGVGASFVISRKRNAA